MCTTKNQRKKKYTKKQHSIHVHLSVSVCTCVCAVVYTCEIAPDRASVCSLQSHIAHMCRSAPTTTTTTSTRPIAHTRIHYRGYYHISVGINENTIFKFVHNNAKRFSRRRACDATRCFFFVQCCLWSSSRWLLSASRYIGTNRKF